MFRDQVELYLESAQVVGHEQDLVGVLERMPGVEAVRIAAYDSPTVESRVLVEFDAGQTNPLVMEETLTWAGFAVLSAGERQPPRD